MKESFENIDGLFKERLENYSPEPPKEIWEKINSRITTREIHFWKWWQVAASVIIISTIGLSVWLTNGDNKDFVSVIEEKTTNENLKTEDQFSNSSNLNSQTSSEIAKEVTSEKEEIIVNKTEIISKKNSNTLNNKIIASFDKITEDSESVIPFYKDENIEDSKLHLLASIDAEPLITINNSYSLIENKKIKQINPEKEKNIDRKNIWSYLSYGGQLTPSLAYHTQPSRGISGNESPLLKSSGGIFAEGKISEKLYIKTGFYYLNIGSNHDRIYLQKLVSNNYQPAYPWESYTIPENEPYYAIFDNSIGEIQLNSDISIIPQGEMSLTFSKDDRNDKDSELSSDIITQNNTSSLDAGINNGIYESMDKMWMQQLKNLEIPLIARYKFLDKKKLDFNLITGVSANILIKNIVVLDDQKIVFAETVNIRRFNMSGTVGLGIEYPLYSKISLTVEPTFKYFLNSINSGMESVKIHPYSFGVYSGIRYSL